MSHSTNNLTKITLLTRCTLSSRILILPKVQSTICTCVCVYNKLRYVITIMNSIDCSSFIHRSNYFLLLLGHMHESLSYVVKYSLLSLTSFPLLIVRVQLTEKKLKHKNTLNENLSQAALLFWSLTYKKCTLVHGID